VDKNVLCKTLSAEYKEALIASMKEVKVSSGESIIKQGGVGDFWYVVESGTLKVTKVFEGETEAKSVHADYHVGESFGELALMFNQRRAASVTATEDTIVWAVDQASFRALILTAASANKESYS